MNKSNKILNIALLAVFWFVSCGSPNYGVIDQKIENEGYQAKFSNKEYFVMLGYLDSNVPTEEDFKKAIAQGLQFDFDERGENYLVVLTTSEQDSILDESVKKKFNEVKEKYGVAFTEAKKIYRTHLQDLIVKEVQRSSCSRMPIEIHAPGAFQGYNHEFTGSVGKLYRINMQLDLENFSGFYYKQAQNWSENLELQIVGFDPITREVEIVESNRDGQYTGLFVGYLLSSGEIYGTYRNVDGETFDFEVEVNDQP